MAAAILLVAAWPAHAAGPSEGAAAPAARIVISLADRRLHLLEAGREARSFPVAIGRPGVAIPLGDSAVIRKRRNPTWRPTAAQRRAKPSLPTAVPPGPGNPLGRFALDLGWAAIAIHGTNEPESVGQRASAGCFRMLPADIEALFDAVPVGTPVRVQRDSVGTTPPAEVRAAPMARAAAAPAIPPARATVPPPPPRPSPPLPVPDPRCPTATAPLRRLICDTPALSALDGRARGLQERFLAGLPDRAVAAYALLQDERRFDDRITALCWVRLGSEGDPAVAASARGCLASALEGRLDDVAKRIAELQGSARVAGR